MSNAPFAVPAASALALALCAAAPAAWAADTITDWNAASGLPTATTPPWLQNGTALSLSGGVLSLNTTSYANNVSFQQNSSVIPGFSLTDGASIEARLRFVSGGTSGDARDTAVLGLTQASNWGNALYIGNGRIFIGSGTNARGATATVDTSVFHTYRIDLGASTGSSASFSVAVDGVTMLNGNTYFSTPDNGASQRFYWGEASSLAYGSSQWQFVRDAAPVPEPGTWALLLAGLLAVGRVARRRAGLMR